MSVTPPPNTPPAATAAIDPALAQAANRLATQGVTAAASPAAPTGPNAADVKETQQNAAENAKALAAELKKLRAKKPEERVKVIINSTEFQKAYGLPINSEEDLEAVRGSLMLAVGDNTKKFDAYLDANLKLAELRLESGMPKDQPLEQARDIKLSSKQKSALEAAEKAEKAAYDTLMGAVPKAEREYVGTMVVATASATNGPMADAAHAEKAVELARKVPEITTRLIEQPRGWLSFRTTPSRLVARLDEANKKGEAGKAEANKIREELRENLLTNKLTRDLPAYAREEIFKALTENTASVLAQNDKANPIDAAVKSAADQAMADVRNAPATLVRDAMTGLPPGASALASRIPPGIIGGRV
jgi:hypothetical protein